MVSISAVRQEKQPRLWEEPNNMKSTKRHLRIRNKLRFVSERPRLSVFRSNKFMYAQIIDDKAGKTLLGMGESMVKEIEKTSSLDRARLLGSAIAKEAVKKKITQVAFDKGRYAYHGRVKALAEGAREGGLDF